MDKETLRLAIQATCTAEGRPVGRRKFREVTGIPDSAWYGKLYATWGDALEDAGFCRNSKNTRVDAAAIRDQYRRIIDHLGMVPSNAQLRLTLRNFAGFHSHNTFHTAYPQKRTLIRAISAMPETSDEVKDICYNWLEKHNVAEDGEPNDERLPEGIGIQSGLVYMLQSGNFFKIGRSDSIERRLKSISVAMPHAVELIHTIKTDDMVGIELYWHRRFKAHRLNGEWFDLPKQEIDAFLKRKIM